MALQYVGEKRGKCEGYSVYYGEKRGTFKGKGG